MNKPKPIRTVHPAHQRQAGFSLIELMVALVIGLFLLLGFTASFMNTKQAFVSQDQLSLLQDNERLALTVLASTVQSAGYFPDPKDATAADNLPARSSATYGNMVAAQGIVGTMGSGTASDTLTSRLVTKSGDGLTDCLGQANMSGTKQQVVNIFAVNAANELVCSVDGGVNFVPLVSNVARFSTTYLADTDPSATVDAYRYQSATATTAANLWPIVKAVRISIDFANPYAAQPGQPATIQWVQTVNLMNK
jgi:type IV pilus assembly protein PilW